SLIACANIVVKSDLQNYFFNFLAAKKQCTNCQGLPFFWVRQTAQSPRVYRSARPIQPALVRRRKPLLQYLNCVGTSHTPPHKFPKTPVQDRKSTRLNSS